jgi:osmotically inducible protein OsmC
MALSAQLGNAGLTPETLETTATLSFEKQEPGWTVTGIRLDVKGKVPKADQAAWDKATQAAKTGCPISRLLNTVITMDAKLESS